MYHEDDGSTVTGIIFVFFIIVSFTCGYWVRDQGIVLNVNKTTITNQVNKGDN